MPSSLPGARARQEAAGVRRARVAEAREAAAMQRARAAEVRAQLKAQRAEEAARVAAGLQEGIR